jgi:hypothetical protein
MAHNDKQDKTKGSGGPAPHPSNQTPKGKNQGGGEGGPGGNKVGQGRGADTGNKGKNK